MTKRLKKKVLVPYEMNSLHKLNCFISYERLKNHRSEGQFRKKKKTWLKLAKAESLESSLRGTTPMDVCIRWIMLLFPTITVRALSIKSYISKSNTKTNISTKRNLILRQIWVLEAEINNHSTCFADRSSRHCSFKADKSSWIFLILETSLIGFAWNKNKIKLALILEFSLQKFKLKSKRQDLEEGIFGEHCWGRLVGTPFRACVERPSDRDWLAWKAWANRPLLRGVDRNTPFSSVSLSESYAFLSPRAF